MFIHIGASRVVFHNELIGIFSLETGKTEANTFFLSAPLSGKDQDHLLSERAKSFIVTDKQVYYSSISPQTLAKRYKLSAPQE